MSKLGPKYNKKQGCALDRMGHENRLNRLKIDLIILLNNIKNSYFQTFRTKSSSSSEKYN